MPPATTSAFPKIYARTDEIDKLLESLYDDIDRAEKALAELGGEK